MNYLEFFGRLKNSDSRIEYKILDKPISDIVEFAPDLYRIVNPVKVEFEFNDGIIKLASYKELSQLKKEYAYVGDGCVFATCNGEPVYVKNNAVYTCVCGKNRVIEEELAESVELLFEQVNDTL